MLRSRLLFRLDKPQKGVIEKTNQVELRMLTGKQCNMQATEYGDKPTQFSELLSVPVTVFPRVFATARKTEKTKTGPLHSTTVLLLVTSAMAHILP